ncbi:CsbD family protein [Amycolatopsis coloradensis]|uniref:CsbD family protein n=1 Tax=Amycolatopsis coloradensis TaxID=76021 RepID=A0A1R0L0W6_9PSEU|nr:CsbD family protein [Amycolatopsis coloradensis]OLZ55438.1 CsbD family protein [Amycolatopsis coloradensis]
MSVFDKAKDKAEQAIGTAKEKLGEKTGNQDMANSGRADQTEGEAKEAGHDLRDRAEGAVQGLKDKFNK